MSLRRQGIHLTASSLLSTLLTTLIASPILLVSSYVIDPNALTDAAQKSLNSALSSKVIFQSPSVENILKEFIVSSKPLSLRKYSNRPKTKKTKKDSRIYYIPIPPLPYRYIPGIGYDYQPMKIKPLLVEPSSLADVPATTDYTPNYGTPQNPYKHYQQQLQNSYYQTTMPGGHQQHHYHHQQQHQDVTSSQIPVTVVPTKPPAPPLKPTDVAESKVYRLDRHDYYFNGRPFRLQVAHAGPKSRLTPQNLKSSFYFNKNIIY
uniref:Uncharacterized protein n=1 Tax=Stomoxys calcitrans TaxID=35570 RepID=A0A1I8PT74_STOCA